eukprot:365424-Chlamydomonas_euryale.AAC.33
MSLRILTTGGATKYILTPGYMDSSMHRLRTVRPLARSPTIAILKSCERPSSRCTCGRDVEGVHVWEGCREIAHVGRMCGGVSVG